MIQKLQHYDIIQTSDVIVSFFIFLRDNDLQVNMIK